MDQVNRIKELVKILNEAGRVYYQEDREIMPNIEYDSLYDELVSLEGKTGIVLSNSPTVNVGYEVMSSLPKEAHEFPMLSLDKTKDIEALESWIGDKEGILSWKLDGLTVVLTYRNGKLHKAVTRGNGTIGEVITSNARVFANLPLQVDWEGELVVRGEAVIKYSDFKRINEEILDLEAKYKNPRNLCSGSVRQLSNRITAERKVNFFAFALVKAGGMEIGNSRCAEMEWLKGRGFETVGYKKVTRENLRKEIEWFSNGIQEFDLPSDGLVLIYEDIEYGKGLGATSKYPRDAIAFKWKDEIRETKLLRVEWSASRTGLINPIGVFEPVELEGTSVARASLHNISIMKELQLGVDDLIEVYKANMIIPQISDNLTRSDSIQIPQNCPVCGKTTEIRNENGVETLFCPNPDCLAKQIKGFAHFVSRNAMNMEGLSEATIEKLIAKGLVKELADLFHVRDFKEEISAMDGFGEKSFANLVKAVDSARTITPDRLLYSLGIPNIGIANAKLIARAAGFDWEKIQNFKAEDLVEIDGVGPVMAEGFQEYFAKEENKIVVADLLKEIRFQDKAPIKETQNLEDKTFVITGALKDFENRNQMKEMIESRGGKVTDSVTSKTDYLINNDKLSSSSKNKKAKELGIRIITEDEFMREMLDA